MIQLGPLDVTIGRSGDQALAHFPAVRTRSLLTIPLRSTGAELEDLLVGTLSRASSLLVQTPPRTPFLALAAFLHRQLLSADVERILRNPFY